MSADQRARVAAVLRERVQAATPGPWRPSPRTPDAIIANWPADDDQLNWYGGLCVGESMQPADRAYVVGLHPGVGAAVANLLATIHASEDSPVGKAAAALTAAILDESTSDGAR